MTEPRTDHNDLARFLDGSLSEEERSRALAHLSASDEDADVLADAAYLLRELETEDGVLVVDAGEDAEADEDASADPATASNVPPEADVDGGDPTVIPLRPPSTQRARRRVPAQWLALAAVLAGVLLVPLALSRSRSPDDFVALLTNRNTGLPKGWADRIRWSGTRGGGDLPPIAIGPGQPIGYGDNGQDSQTLKGRAARLGALQVDLEVAAGAGQAEEARQFSGAIVEMLADISGSGPVAAAYRDIGTRAGQPGAPFTESLTEARESLALFVGEDQFNLGAWTEAARIAAERQDTAFFHARTSRKMLARAVSLPSLNEEGRTTVKAIRTAAEAEQPDWNVLKMQTLKLLLQIGSSTAVRIEFR